MEKVKREHISHLKKHLMYDLFLSINKQKLYKLMKSLTNKNLMVLFLSLEEFRLINETFNFDSKNLKTCKI